MYAIVKTGGKQYRVAEGDVISIEKLEAAPGDEVSLAAILLVDGGTVTHDAGQLAEASVTAEVVAQTKGPKIRIHKYKNKTRYHKRMGHRQKLTEVKITAITGAGSSQAAVKSESEPESADIADNSDSAAVAASDSAAAAAASEEN